MNLNNISQIRYGGKDITLAKLNGDILYKRGDTPVEPIEKEYAIEYTITARNSTDTLSTGYNSSCYYYLPLLYTGTSSTGSVTNYDKILITKTDGTTTDDITTKANEISLIKLWYTKDTYRISFKGYSTTNPCYIKEILNGNRMNMDNITDMSHLFYYCTKLTTVDVSNWNTSNVTNMSNMFSYCNRLTSVDVSNCNTSNVTNMSDMFCFCSSLTSVDVSNWNTSNVTNMYYMFSSCTSLTSLDLSNFDTSNVTSMDGMFNNCPSLTSLDLSNFNTSNVTYMVYMFFNCSSLTSLDLSGFNTSSVTDMSYMFANTSSISYIQIEFDTSNVTDMSYMFSGCGAIVSCHFHFNGDCSHMFENFTGHINALLGGKPTNASYMFASSNIDDGAFSSYIYYIDLQSCQNTSYMFYNCQNIYNLSFSDSTYHNMCSLYESAYMFADCFKLTLIEIPYMSTNYLWNYENMFYNIPDYCTLKIDRSLFCLDETSTGFSGYFQDY